MRLGTWNILHATLLDPSNQSAGFEPLVALHKFAEKISSLNLDLLALQEVDEGLARSGQGHQLKYLSNETKMLFWSYARTIIGAPGEDWREAKKHESLINHHDYHLRATLPAYGIGTLSKLPIAATATLELGKAPFGLPLAIATGELNKKSRAKTRFIYVPDEPRLALATILENEWVIINTHLSFVPFYNHYQLQKIKKWAKKLGDKIIILGDFNIPGKIPTWGRGWRELHPGKSYPAWDPKIKFDHIITNQPYAVKIIPTDTTGYSDHLPLIIEIN